MVVHKWISSDGSELVPTTDVKINLTILFVSTSISWRIKKDASVLGLVWVLEIRGASSAMKTNAPYSR
jgi:hypothetical protein